MSLKRPRIHLSGISNKDFRTKGEVEEIRKYQPFHESKNFGMLGLANYKLPYSIHQELFKPTRGINEGKYIENDVQNPKIYDTALFYQKHSMKIKPKSLLFSERVKQLDTSDHRGGEEFNGDSMMICEINKQRKEIKMKEKLIQENLKKKHIGVISGGINESPEIENNNNLNDIKDNNINMENKTDIINNVNDNNKDYDINNKDNCLTSNKNINDININKQWKERRMVKSSSDKIFLNKKVSKERLNIIKNKIYNRLKTHNNIKEIFLNWQKNYLNNKELSMYDLHKIINDIGIPITYNEVFALISSANKRNTDKLNYEEFKNFLLNNDTSIDIDLSKIPYRNESLFIENKKKEEEDKNQQLKNLRISKSENYFTLQKIIRRCYPNFLQTMKKIQNNNSENNESNKELNGICDLTIFKKVLETIKIPEKFKNDSIINTIYNQYKISDNLMNYEKFIENCKNIKETNDFFIFQNGYLNLIQRKLEKNEEERKKYNDILVENQEKKKYYLKNLGSQIGIDSYENISSNNKRLYKNKSDFNIYKSSINSEINKNKKYNLENNKNENINKDYKTIDSLKINDNKNKNQKNIFINNYKYNNQTDFYNHYQPSLNFIDYVFRDNKLYNDRYYKAIDEISPLIPKKTNDKNDTLKKNFSDLNEKKNQSLLNSRKFNKHFLSSEMGTPGYLEEGERYKILEPSKEEKEKKVIFLKNTLKRKFDINKEWNDKINFQQKVLDINNSLGQIKRTKSLLRYQERMNNINNIGI